MGYLPGAESERQQMLREVGAVRPEDLFRDVPHDMRAGPLKLHRGRSELEVRRLVEALAAENAVYPTIFRGAGAYRHYIPSIVKQVAAKESFVTAYTPYQAEISQGILQIIFEYQSEICALTGMEVSNASVYDGASAAAEATVMCRDRGRQRVLVAGGTNPATVRAVQTYCQSAGAPVQVLPTAGGLLDLEALQQALGDDVACLVVQSPNYWGLIERPDAAAELCRAAGAKLVVSCNPMALPLFKTPGEMGADVAVGDAQPLGLPTAFGGPYIGYMACTKEMMRRLPGRIVGQTADADGKRCFVLTLQAREQHIRREKALSSICSNQALCALTVSAYLAAMGGEGLREASAQCYAKAHYLAEGLARYGFARRHERDFFNEFLTECPADSAVLMQKLEARGILGGLPADGGILWCCTELNTKEEMDAVVAVCKEVAGYA